MEIALRKLISIDIALRKLSSIEIALRKLSSMDIGLRKLSSMDIALSVVFERYLSALVHDCKEYVMVLVQDYGMSCIFIMHVLLLLLALRKKIR